MIKKTNKEYCYTCNLVKFPIVVVGENGKYSDESVNKKELEIISSAIAHKAIGDMGEETDIEKLWRHEYGIQICINIIRDKDGNEHMYKACWCGSQGMEKFKNGIKKARAQIFVAAKL